MIADLFNRGSMPVVESLVRFTGARHALITENIANLSTPHFRPRDLDPRAFQRQLADAVDRRRETAARNGDYRLQMKSTRQVRVNGQGFEVRPEPRDEGILFHDRNNRNLERIMQDLAENTMIQTAGMELLKSDFDMLKTAIRGRV